MYCLPHAPVQWNVEFTQPEQTDTMRIVTDRSVSLAVTGDGGSFRIRPGRTERNNRSDRSETMRGHGFGRYRRSGNEEAVEKKNVEMLRSAAKLFAYLAPYWWLALLVLVLSVSVTGLNLVHPRLIRILLDGAIADGDGGLLNRISLLFLAVIAGAGLLQFTNSFLRHRLGQQIIKTLRIDLYRHLQDLSLTFYESRETGDIMSRVVNDTESVEDLVVHTVESFLSSVLILGGVALILFFSNWRLASLTLIPIPLIALCIFFFAGRFHSLFRKVRERTADINTYLQERISGVRIVKAFATEEQEREAFNSKAQSYYDARMRAILGFSAFRPLIMFLGATGTLMVVFFGGRLAIRDPQQMSVGQLVEFVMYLGFFYAPVSQLGFLIGHQLPRGLAAADRVFEFLNTSEQLPVADDAVHPEAIEGEIRMESVTFRYGSEDVLKDISLTIPPGRTLALVGRSGVGKTTMVDLISRFYDPAEGRLYIDGIRVSRYHPTALRKHIGVVLQEPFLFNTSVRENIAYGRSSAAEEEIEHAAELSGAKEFIERLPDRYDTIVGERGVKLSVGQKQRISIARALLKNPSILILDEATSSVDTETERMIQDALERASRGRTTIIIAHRLSTTSFADQVAVLAGGRIAEIGAPAELLRRDSVYAGLWRMQRFGLFQNGDESL